MVEHAQVTELVGSVDTDSGQIIRIFTLSLGYTKVEVCTLGASITKFLVSGGDDIVLGYKDAATQLQSRNLVFFGAIVGRVANRIANGRFTLDDKTYNLETNNGPNHLHGGNGGFSHKIWDAAVVDINGGAKGVRFTMTSPDNDQGYPGSVQATATYSLVESVTSGVVLRLQIKAKVLDGQVTPINLAQHSYFNLSPSQNSGILDHRLTMESDSFTPVDDTSIPTREVRSLDDDSVMDWRTERTLREALLSYGVEKVGLSQEQSQQNLEQRKLPSEQKPYGFDHNYVIRKQPGVALAKVACLSNGTRRLKVYSNAPGVQLYTSNYLGDHDPSSTCKSNYGPWQGICLETQHFPDSVADEIKGDFGLGKCFLLRPGGADYEHVVEYHYSETDEYVGSDTCGTRYKSIDEMWEAMDLGLWYGVASDYYEENCTTTLDGVLGGLSEISPVDLEGSKLFLEGLALPPNKEGTKSVACECGAGIGRVTKGLLLDFCDRCDLVESSPRLLNTAPEFIGDRSYRCRFVCSGLQEWEPTAGKYTIIWIQWVLCYLTDDHIVAFLRKCGAALVEGGVIILKENTCATESFIVDMDDASVTRSVSYWRDLISKADLQVVQQSWQKDFPGDIFPVPMFAITS
jgi:galactose mutarotase-like enzyme